MSLGVAFAGIIFLFLLVFCLYFAWGSFFSFSTEKTTTESPALEHSPEWQAFLNRRQEIENDPALDEASKKVLIDNWSQMASESKPHMQPGQAVFSTQLAWATSRTLPWLIATALLSAGVFAYLVGAVNPGAAKWPQPNSNLDASAPTVDQAVAASAGHPGDGASLEERLQSLQARLEAEPDDLRGWALLARTHASMSNYAESANALKRALALSPGHPDILADLADMTAMAQGRQLAGEPQTYIAQALQSDPRHEKALALAASAAEQAGDQDKAQVYWQLLSQVQQSKLSNSGNSNSAPAQPAEDVLTTVNVKLPAQVPAGFAENSALFVFIKAQAGPGMPLAVVRVPASQLNASNVAVRIGPGDFIQETGMAQLPEQLHLQARLSIQGMAQVGQGDVESPWVSVKRNQLESGVSVAFPDRP